MSSDVIDLTDDGEESQIENTPVKLDIKTRDNNKKYTIPNMDSNVINLIDCDDESKIKKTPVKLDIKTRDDVKVHPVALNNGKRPSIISRECKRKSPLESKIMHVNTERTTDSTSNKMSKRNLNLVVQHPTNVTKTSILKSTNTANNNGPIHNSGIKSKYPPPYPKVPQFYNKPLWKRVPYAPNLKINTTIENTVTLIWDMKFTSRVAEVKGYELYVCRETEAIPIVSMWKLVDNIEAYKLPMVCELHSFVEGFTYHFALRAVDVYERRSPFSGGLATLPRSHN